MTNGPNPAITRTEFESAQTLATDLENVRTAPRPLGAIGSSVLAFFSLGTLPALLWHDRFKDFVDEERVLLRRFADWIRLKSDHPATMPLRNASEWLLPRTILSAFSVLAVVGIVIVFASQISGNRPILERFLSYTYNINLDDARQHPEAQSLFVAWNIVLSAAFLFHWIQVQAHNADVRRFVRYANEIFQSKNVLRVQQPSVGIGFSFLWIIAAALLASKNAWWGVAMALGGAVQYRYMASQSPRLRRMLAARVRELGRLPASGIGQKCPHAGCLAPLPAGSKFCTRCGRKLSA